MPYKYGERLPGERASRLGHLEVLKSELVNRLVKSFEDRSIPATFNKSLWELVPIGIKPLPLVFGIDGSMQPIESDTWPYKGDLFLTDMLGFHQEMAPDSAPDTVATAYMNIHEVLLLFTGIRYYWEKNRDVLSNCLFVKDGPLTIRAQYSKLVNPIRRFLAYARNQGCPIYIIGQEKSGRFYDHLELIGRDAPIGHLFIPSNQYIKEEIQHRPNTGAPYGRDTNYAAKLFVKLNKFQQMVLNIPTGKFVENPVLSNLIGADRIFATLPTILSNRYEGALLPIELANGIASLSTYPSAQILKIFAEAQDV